ncbi:hypothetical protein DJFAAGMI_01146 [Comamonas sp. PE63]|uniref:GGDEF domain-containing protein n=1 Tax=Comamonas brasiliensis TaxID=1812482 RepID=A0ABS5LPY7_9BURK|nr:hypothetical protein [Comamonas sp. PE63]
MDAGVAVLRASLNQTREQSYESLETLLKRADAAFYAAKAPGHGSSNLIRLIHETRQHTSEVHFKGAGFA